MKCSICLVTPCTLPIRGCKSCESIIGCRTCIYDWCGGNIEKPCPKFWGARGLAHSFLMKGLVDLFSFAKNLNQSLSLSDTECTAES